ncbi:TPA: hypothetical protein N0F65_007211 [Lagenidium giganteum]|uniref:Neurochondrin-like protein n=1 Tax=Lagenidium giganteum TaxID=4803 RepID=A0AAV2Z6Q4_9STRA|nr:TPA: hypothetical protein N0F65_007211 [Lagenidium giganteum]
MPAAGAPVRASSRATRAAGADVDVTAATSVVTSPGADAMSPPVADCLRMLQGGTDEHKFAGLLMLTKVTDLSVEEQRSLRAQGLAAVGAKFCMRLLFTKGTDGSENISSFQTLGLNLIASFCEDASVAQEFATEKLVRAVLELLDNASATPEQQMDCIGILLGLAATSKGKQLLAQEALLGRIFSSVKAVTRVNTSAQDKADKDESGGSDHDNDVNCQVLERVWALMATLAEEQAFWQQIRINDFTFLFSCFANVRGAVSANMLGMFNTYMALVDSDSISPELLSSQCLSDIRVGVLRFLRAKWPHQERDQCLRLIYLLMRHSGVSWMISGTTLRNQGPQDEVSGGKFMIFLLKLIALETKLMLDEVELGLVEVEEVQVENVSELERREREIARVLHVLPICYGIVEMLIAGLVIDVDKEMMLPYDILLDMKQTFNQMFAVVLELLTLARDYMKTHRYHQLEDEKASSVEQLNAVVYASIRVIGAWIAEDTESSEDQIVDLIPFLLCYQPVHADNSAMDASNPEDALDSDGEVDSDDELDHVQQRRQDDLDQLHFLLPGLLQLSATPKVAKAFSGNPEVLRRLMHFCCKLCTDMADGTSAYGSLPTLNMCLGVLINLILISGGDDNTGKESSAMVISNATEWFRSLTFLLPMVCACGAQIMEDQTISQEDRADDDRYLLLLHATCIVLLIASHFSEKKLHPCRLHASVVDLVQPFNAIMTWISSHPPHPKAESTSDLFQLVRNISMRAKLTQKMFER